jgi:uncharacterized membrane protein
MARQRVLGLPIGKQKPRYQVARTAGAAAAILAPALAVPVARKAAPAVKKVGRVARGAGYIVDKGQDMASKASDVMETASNVKEAVSSHSSTIGKVGGLIKAIARGGGGSGQAKPKLSHLIEQHVDVAVPRTNVYNQWTQFEMFPTLTKGIESASQEEDDKVKWTAKIGPSRRTWTGKIVEQIPDERIAWKSEGGASLQGAVTFHSLSDDLTRVLLQMEYKPTGPVEWTGNTLRIQRRRAKRDLRLFKHFIEMRGEETGAWRGRIEADESLEPQFSGQGKLEGDGSDTKRSSRSSSRAGSQSKGSPQGRRNGAAPRNGRRASTGTSSRQSSSRTRSSSSARNSSNARSSSRTGGSSRRARSTT